LAEALFVGPTTRLQSTSIVSQWTTDTVLRSETNVMAQNTDQRRIAWPVYLALFFILFLYIIPENFADQTAPLTVEQPQKQTIVLTHGFSTTIHRERPFAKISITNPEIVDLVLRTDKSAVLIPEHLGRTNVDFLDDHGSVIGSMEIIVTRQSTTDRVVVYDHPTLGAYSSYHCGPWHPVCQEI
jgi:Flp pilus assembly secretin CpaC